MMSLNKLRFMSCRVGIFSRRQIGTESQFFPWRHDTGTMERVLEPNDLSGQPQNQRARYFRYILAARELNKSYFQILLSSAWQSELATDFSFAFQMSLASLLSEKFQVPIESIFKAEEATLDFRTSPATASWTDEDRITSKALTNTLLEDKLWKKYQSLDSTTIDMRLKITPVNARIEHAFVVPVLTRESLKENPSLKGSYRKMEVEFQKNKDIDQARALASALIDATGNIGIRTVIFDVSIACLELFQIKDLATGEVLQGNDDDVERMVTHLVRFEMVTTSGSAGERMHGSWQVVDWDDLCNNNQWY